MKKPRSREPPRWPWTLKELKGELNKSLGNLEFEFSLNKTGDKATITVAKKSLPKIKSFKPLDRLDTYKKKLYFNENRAILGLITKSGEKATIEIKDRRK